MKKYRNPLRRSILLGCGAFVILLCLTLSTLGFIVYYQAMLEKFQTYIGDALRLAITEIDGEDLKNCIESGNKSRAFRRTQNFLDRMKENYEFAFICIVKPLNLNETDNMMDVMAGMTEAEREEFDGGDAVELGHLTGNSYSPKVVQYYLNRMDGGTEISYYRNRTEFGYMYTGLLPITDNAGNTTAILAADLSMEDIERTLFHYVLILLAEIAILAALSLSILYRWLNRRVIAPMTKLERSANSFVETSRGQTNPDALAFHAPDIRTGDELESLSDAISAMAYDLKRFMQGLLKASAEVEERNQQINALLKSVVAALSIAIDERSHYTANHTKNMARFAERFLDWLDDTNSPIRFDAEKRQEFLMSVWLHDIGKLTVPLRIMDKADRLGDKWMEVRYQLRVIGLLNRLAEAKGEIDADEADRRCREVEETWEFIERIDRAGFLSEEDFRRVEELAARTFTDERGVTLPWITDEERLRLSIRKGTLTAEEREVMQSHAAMTRRILGHISFPDSYAHVPAWAGAHHEQLNGRGYPQGLTADDIPTEVRILTILDVFEALTAKDRPYKKPFSAEKALAVLRDMEKQGAVDGQLLSLFEQSRAWEGIL